ncbi:MAG: hypothetical protein JXM69_06675 [Anaerolineae bacterium]|nr:hypothetical protein [Anaerolineae bacterium]
MVNESNRSGLWRLALIYALPMVTVILGLFYYWFALADRYFVFLYYHDMGPLYPDTSPFSAVTSSRYWMAGLVASGVMLVLYVLANLILGRLTSSYQAPGWQRIWLMSVIPLVVGIPLITMTVNQPTLPAWNAAQVTLVTLIGLALALLPGEMAARRPVHLGLLVVDGFGLMMLLLNTAALEETPRWLASGRTVYFWMMGLGLMMGVGLLLVMTGVHIWWRTFIPKASEVFVAGLCVAYLLMPLLHHVCFTDGYYYLTDQDNFLARNMVFQVTVWLLAAAMAAGVTRLREYLAAKWVKKPRMNVV